uniref:Dolichyl-P-Glc:Glc(2)Man(9)GlcNAc(2)-PP-dolichol alpha-1,2-glucosyltransferase n=1 Tax=Haemonchus placei TaxID=6290 RepID=A0A0N4WJB2_HAEPC
LMTNHYHCQMIQLTNAGKKTMIRGGASFRQEGVNRWTVHYLPFVHVPVSVVLLLYAVPYLLAALNDHDAVLFPHVAAALFLSYAPLLFCFDHL